MNRAFLLAQEARCWADTEIDGSLVLAAVDHDCAIIVPRAFRAHVGGVIHRNSFSVATVFDIVLISLHLPTSDKHNDEVSAILENLTQCMLESLGRLGKARDDARIILGGDLNTTLPAGYADITGPCVLHRSGQNRERIRTIMEWLASWKLRALNTWPGDSSDSTALDTWSNTRGARTQIDYVCVSPCFTGMAAVNPSLGVKTDHVPIDARITGKNGAAGKAVAVARSLPTTGWMPKADEEGQVDFRRSVAQKLGISMDAPAGCSDVNLELIEQHVAEAGQETAHSTTADRGRRATKAPESLKKLRRDWKQELDPESRKKYRAEYFKERRKFRRQRAARRLKALSSYGVVAGGAAIPSCLLIGKEVTASRSAWRTEAQRICEERYSDPGNDETAEMKRTQLLDSVVVSAQLDGRRPPKLPLQLVLDTRASLKTGKAGASDGTVAEQWKSLPTLVMIMVWKLFAARMRGGADESPASAVWKIIDLLGIPKISRPGSLMDFRYIAKTPILQKWYFRCLMTIARTAARETAVLSCGFKPGFSTMHVTELLRQVLHKSREWGFPALIGSVDVRLAFDSMRFDDLVWALQSRNVDPWTTRAILREYLDLKARVSIADSGSSSFFSYRRGGRQGGVETPDLFVFLLDGIMEPIVQQWSVQGFGVHFDDFNITHVIWADNIFIFASDRTQLKEMTAMVSQALPARSMGLKTTEATFIKGIGTDSIDSSTADIEVTEALALKHSEHMVCLGVYLDRWGSTAGSITHRAVQATKCYYKHSRALTDPSGGIKDRLLAYCSSVRATYAYNAGGWHITADILSTAITWENQLIRKIFRMRRRPEEGQFEYNARTARRTQLMFDNSRIPRIHHCILTAVHRWAGVVVASRSNDLRSPLGVLLEARCARAWLETRETNQLLDPRNEYRWRHRKPGQLVSFEGVLIRAYGEDWLDAAKSGDTSWKRTRLDFVEKVCTLWVKPKPHLPGPGKSCTLASSIMTPMWLTHAVDWARPDHCFEFRVDNKPLADWLSGQARCSTPKARARLNIISERIAEWLSGGPWMTRAIHYDWIRWVPRCSNAVADALANFSMDCQCSIGWQSDAWSTLRRTSDKFNVVVLTDGGARIDTASAGWVIFLWRPTHKLPLLVACGGILLEAVSSDVAELTALEIGVEAFAQLTLRRECLIPHEAQPLKETCMTQLAELREGNFDIMY